MCGSRPRRLRARLLPRRHSRTAATPPPPAPSTPASSSQVSCVGDFIAAPPRPVDTHPQLLVPAPPTPLRRAAQRHGPALHLLRPPRAPHPKRQQRRQRVRVGLPRGRPVGVAAEGRGRRPATGAAVRHGLPRRRCPLRRRRRQPRQQPLAPPLPFPGHVCLPADGVAPAPAARPAGAALAPLLLRDPLSLLATRISLMRALVYAWLFIHSCIPARALLAARVPSRPPCTMLVLPPCTMLVLLPPKLPPSPLLPTTHLPLPPLSIPCHPCVPGSEYKRAGTTTAAVAAAAAVPASLRARPHPLASLSACRCHAPLVTLQCRQHRRHRTGWVAYTGGAREGTGCGERAGQGPTKRAPSVQRRNKQQGWVWGRLLARRGGARGPPKGRLGKQQEEIHRTIRGDSGGRDVAQPSPQNRPWRAVETGPRPAVRGLAPALRRLPANPRSRPGAGSPRRAPRGPQNGRADEPLQQEAQGERSEEAHEALALRRLLPGEPLEQAFKAVVGAQGGQVWVGAQLLEVAVPCSTRGRLG